MIGLARVGGNGTAKHPHQPQGAESLAKWSMIDLRPGGKGEGWCLVGGPVLPAGALTLGDDPKGRSRAASNLLRNRLNVNLGDNPLGREILSLLLEHGRTDGKGWRPLQPNRRKRRYEVWIGGELLDTVPLTRGGAVITDDFNRADGPIGAAWVATSGTQQISSNRLHTDGIGVAIHGTPLPESDMRVTLENVTLASSPPAIGPVARIDLPTTSDGYWAYWRLDVGRIQLFRLGGNLTGTPTQTAITGFDLFGGSSAVAVQAIGSTIQAISAGTVILLTVTDTVIPGNFGHGLMGYQVGGTYTDSYRAETFGGWHVGFVGT